MPSVSTLLLTLVILSDLRNVTSESNEYCNQSLSGLTYQYTCRYNESYGNIIKINLSDSVIGINCDGFFKLDSSLLENLGKKQKLQYVYIRECPIPKIGLGTILSTNFDMTQVKQLSFEEQNNDDPLTGEFFEGLSNLQYLLLNKNNISVWRPDMLNYVTNIDTLRLDHNRLILYDKMFHTAENLIFLSISYNNLTHLPNAVFAGLKKLQGLQLTDNRIQNINVEVFNEIGSLTNLNLSSNLLHHLDDNLFSNLNQLSWISLSNNRFANISKKIFSYCKPEFVEFYDNSDIILTDGEFSNFFSLELLDLSGNGLIHLPQNLFTGSTSLKSISLHKNLLRFLPDHIFEDQENLEELFLSFNKLEVLTPDIFSSLKKMRRLYLNNNYLTKMSDYILRNALSLKIIDLSHNKLLSFELLNIAEDGNRQYRRSLQNTSANPQTFHLHLKLQMVDLSHNNLVHYPTESQVIIDARNISLEYNSIQYFNTSFLGPTNVKRREINLENNNITAIYFQDAEKNIQTYKNSKLKVRLSHNPIHCDCEANDLINYLSWRNANDSKRLQIDVENLKCELPPPLKNIPFKNVVATDLMCQLDDCTEYDECECFYKPAEKILIANCSNKNLLNAPQLKIDNKSHGRVDSVEVHLDGNSLTQFSENDGYTRVSKLYLHNNFIKNVSWIPPSTQVLDLSNNKLKLFDSELLMTLDEMNIGELNLAHNPWTCDCENIEFSHFLEQHISNIIDTDNIRCNVTGENIIDLNEEELCPVKIHRGLTVLALSLLFSFIIIMNVLLFYIYRKTILTWLYANGLCLWLIKEERIDRSKIYDAFVSFANEDEKFVVENLLPNLEKGTPSYKLCLHMRDWIPGEYITDQINRSVRISRRTLVILSTNFLKSVWGKMEFRAAHTEAQKEGRVRVIVIIYGDIDMKSMDDEWKAYMRTNTYIKWGDPWFWEKLRYALPRSHKIMKK